MLENFNVLETSFLRDERFEHAQGDRPTRDDVAVGDGLLAEVDAHDRLVAVGYRR